MKLNRSDGSKWKSFPIFGDKISRCFNWLAPTLCPICLEPQQDSSIFACDDCIGKIRLNVSGCSICNDHIESGEICGRCIANPPHFDCLIAPWVYQDPLDSLVLKTKFQQNYSLAWRLGQAAAQYILACYSYDYPQALVPVPLHPSRLRERGYNQANFIASAISSVSGIKVYNDIAIKKRATSPQSKLTASERATNLINAFSATKYSDVNHIAIVDDVATSGATFNELAKALKKIGYQRVDCWCLARSKKQ